MKRCFIVYGLIVLQILFYQSMEGIELNYPNHATHLASSNITLLSESASSSFHNPSHFNRGFSFSYSNPFSMSEIIISSVTYSDHLRKVNYSIGNQNFNEENYNENHVFLNINYPLKYVTSGINFRYLNQKTSNYRRVSAFLFDAGLSYKKYPLNTTLFCTNVSGSEYKQVKLPLYYHAEIAYYLHKKSVIGFCIEDNDMEELEYKIGNKSELAKNLQFIASYQINRSQFSFGTEIKLNMIKIAYGIQIHEYLNPSHSISIDYLFE